MKNLINVSTRMWVFISCIVVATILTTFYLLNFKITSSMPVTLKPTLTENIVYVSEKDGFKIKVNDNLKLKINDHYYESNVKNIKYDLEHHRYKFTLSNRLPFVAEDALIPAQAVYKQESIIDMLFNHI